MSSSDPQSTLAVDWGTSTLRGALVGADGSVLGERSVARGILSVPPGDFPAVLDAHFGDWRRSAPLCLVAGMAGSKQGWLEAPYCACPAGADDIAARLAWVEPGRIAIVPGVQCEAGGVPDVMRGEETQVFGALQLLGIDDALLVLPGTHSKWVRVAGGRIERFATAMTGEFYGLLRRHSILARTLPAGEDRADGGFDAAAFDRGIEHALRSAGLMASAFSVRTLALTKRLDEDAGPSYLSGLVIGEELRMQALDDVRSVVAIGDPSLTERYGRALGSLGIDVLQLGSAATWRGLHAVAGRLRAGDPHSHQEGATMIAPQAGQP